MTVQLSLNPEQVQRLHEAAQARGVDDDALLNEIVGNALDAFAEPAIQPAKRALGRKVAGLQWIADDFDAPLPDSFWLGKE